MPYCKEPNTGLNVLMGFNRFINYKIFSTSIFFLVGPSFIVKLIWYEKQIFLSILRGNYCLIHLKIVKMPKKLNYNVEILFKTS